MRVAAIDCGTNSIRLLVADIEHGRLTDVVRQMQIVRLGQGVDRTGQLDPQALERTFAAVDEYAATCAQHQVSAVRFVATSATRDAANRDEFTAGVRARLGVEPEVITGLEEAALSFNGAVAGLPLPDAAQGSTGPVLVVDIGGGSTEAALGVRDAGGETTMLASKSVDVGCVRLTERHGGDLLAVQADAEAGVAQLAQAVDFSKAHAVVGLAGSVTTVTAHALRLNSYDPAVIHGAQLPIADLMAACSDLIEMPTAQLVALPFMHPGRRDVIRAGATVWRAVLARVGESAGLQSAITSEHDILDGIAWALADHTDEGDQP